MIYFDNSATTKPCDEVIRVINEDLTGENGGSRVPVHECVMNAAKAYAQAFSDCV